MLDISPNSKHNRFRVKRISMFIELIDKVIEQKGTCKILDVGGTISYWDIFKEMWNKKDIKITILNVYAQNTSDENYCSVVGDARNLKEFKDKSFDIAHSNSVIEHVGSWPDMVSMANEVRRVGLRYFVQTPNFWFPIEPHARSFLFHYIPHPIRMEMVLRKRRGFWDKQKDIDAAMRKIESAYLIGKKQMQFLFPDGRIWEEKFCGLTKSLVAIKEGV